MTDAGTGFRLTGSALGAKPGFRRGAEDIEAVEEEVETEGTWSCLKGRPRSIVLCISRNSHKALLARIVNSSSLIPKRECRRKVKDDSVQCLSQFTSPF